MAFGNNTNIPPSQYGGGGYGEAVGAGAAATEPVRNSLSAGQEVDSLYYIYAELDQKFNQLIDGQDTPLEIEMPPIQDKHASLFFMTRKNIDKKTASLINYMNFMLAAKEYLSKLPDHHSIKEALTETLREHETLFNKITDITFMIRYAPSFQAYTDALKFIGEELLTNTANNAFKDLLNKIKVVEEKSSDSVRTILEIKNDRELELSLAYGPNGHTMWPISVLPFNMLSSIVNSSILNAYPLAENLIKAAHAFMDIRIVQNRTEFLEEKIRLGIFDDKSYKMVEDLCHQCGISLPSKALNKKNKKTQKIYKDIYQQLLQENENKRLNLDLSIELHKISYEVFRYIPELVMQEFKNKMDFNKHRELKIEASSLEQLEIFLNKDDPNFQERQGLIQELKTSFKTFHVDHGLSLSENIANYFLDSLSRNAIFEYINNFIASESNISYSSKYPSKKIGAKKKEKASTKEINQAEKMNTLFEEIKAFIHRTVPQAIPSSQKQRFTALTHYWVPCTFKSIEDSINYHQMKHSPGDDQISYMQEAKNCMDRELQIRPPTLREQYNNKLTRRGHNLQDSTLFLRLVRNSYTNEWRIATFHSPRFTDQAHEPDGIAKLKAGESYRRYDPEPTDSASYAITQHLIRTKIA